ncbi:hypothetical protein HAX54_049349, partial [Datura stramonium]|nr:hypothetical protein [Datura stramonium]
PTEGAAVHILRRTAAPLLLADDHSNRLLLSSSLHPSGDHGRCSSRPPSLSFSVHLHQTSIKATSKRRKTLYSPSPCCFPCLRRSTSSTANPSPSPRPEIGATTSHRNTSEAPSPPPPQNRRLLPLSVSGEKSYQTEPPQPHPHKTPGTNSVAQPHNPFVVSSPPKKKTQQQLSSIIFGEHPPHNSVVRLSSISLRLFK